MPAKKKVKLPVVPGMRDELRSMQKGLAQYNKVIQKIKDSNAGATQMAVVYVHLRDFTALLSEQRKAFNALQEYLAKTCLPDMFEEEDIKTLTLDSLGVRLTGSSKVMASIKSGMKEEALKWLRDNNLVDLIQETVNSSTLAATAKELGEEGKELDDDLFNTYIQNNTSVTKVK